MELTQELLLAALDALMDRSLSLAQEYRTAGFQASDPEVGKGLRDLAELHSERLDAASRAAAEVRANGVANVTLVPEIVVPDLASDLVGVNFEDPYLGEEVTWEVMGIVDGETVLAQIMEGPEDSVGTVDDYAIQHVLLFQIRP